LVLSHPGRKARWLRLALAVLLAVLAVSAAGYLVAASLPARRIAARWAASGGQETRHVLLYVADTTRADALDYSKEPGSKTPRIAAWADSAAVFSHAYANASWTLPSHASLFTGELPCDHRAVSSHQWLSEEARTIAEQMRKNSFFTVGFSENPNVGRANNMDQGFDRYYRLYLNGGRMGYVFPAFVKRVARETDTALGLQSKPAASLASKLWPPCRGAAEITVLLRDLFESHAKAPLPLFVFVNVMDVHSPYHATEEGRRAALAHVDSTRLKELNGFDERRRDYGDYLAGGNVLSQADLRALRSLYQGEVGAVDKAFGDLLEGLNAQGVDERCLIVFTSDHGEEFGEHNLLSHHFCAYETLVRVPLIVRCPWEAAFANGRRYGVPVQLADLPPTIAHLMGVPWTPNPKSVGVNLVLAMNEASRVLYGQYDPHAGVLERLEREHPGHDFSRLDRRLAWSLDKAFKRIRASDGTVESYDLEEDPEESWDLNSQGSAESGILQEHERWLAQRPERTAVKTDPATQKRLRDLGYVQ